MKMLFDPRRALALLLFTSTALAAEVAIPSTNYVVIAPTPALALERQRQLEWSARVFETLMGMRPPRGRVTLTDTPSGSVVGAAGTSTALVNTFPLTPQPPAADGTVWNLSWFARERGGSARNTADFSVLTHEAAHLQLIFTVNFHSSDALKKRFNGYGSFLPDWLDEAVAVYHEPDALRRGRRERFKLSTHIPLRTFFTMNHPGEAGGAQVIEIEAKTPEEAQRKLAEFRDSQHDNLRTSAEALTKDPVSVDEFYTQSLAVIEYLAARGGAPFFRFVLVQQNYGFFMDDILRDWQNRQKEIVSQRAEIESAASKTAKPLPVAKDDPAGPRPPRANSIAGVLVRPGEPVNPMPASVEVLEADFVRWIEQNYPNYRPNLPPYPSK
jgi:hypothetical protein